MPLTEDINKLAANLSLNIREAQGIHHINVIVADCKSYNSRQKLEYRARFRINETEKAVKFTEALQESEVGFSSGSPLSRAGFKADTFDIRNISVKVSIEDQTTLFEKRYTYSYDFSSIRDQIEVLTDKAGYRFKYQITTVGI